MTGLPQIGRDKLADQVARVLEQRILGGEWHPGHPVPPENELASQLAVSRTVVRDAVKTLVARGLVNVRQGVGTHVAEPSDETYADSIFLLLLRSDVRIRDVLEARELIEVALAGIAAERGLPEDWAHLRRCLDEFAAAAAARDWPLGSIAHLDFHLGILDAVHSPVLEVLLRPMQQIILGTGYGPVVEDDPATWNVPVHEELLETLERGDPERARAAMKRHFAFRGDELYADHHSTRFRDALPIRAELERRSAGRR